MQRIGTEQRDRDVVEGLDRLRRNARVVVIEDDATLEELVMAWLASRGMQSVPIPGNAGLDREVGTGPSSSRTGLPGHHEDHVESRLRDSTSPTVVLIVSPDVNSDESSSSESPADTIRQHESASVSEWVGALRLKTYPTGRDHIRLGPLQIDAARRSVTILSSDIRLTPTEFRLLNYLAENEGRIVGHTELLSTVWNPGYADDIHLLQETIRALRGRIALVTDMQLIESVYGAGYRIAAWAAENPTPDGGQEHAGDAHASEHPRPETGEPEAGNP
jgi:DNA-binding response OmpR family regulator